ncbi:MAG: hypothetical protein KGJ62_06040 [Armatimonadetes bacterium]|nr:hypothetical protein [Armatimonadota bacterium]MDE2205926.1 hypothetical protein [Armatimonadota bacterium]
MAVTKSGGAPGSAALLVGIVAGIIISAGATMGAAMGMLKANVPEFLGTNQLLAGGAGLGLLAGYFLASRSTSPLKGAIVSAIGFAVAAAVVLVPLAVISYNQTAVYASIDHTMAYNSESAASCIAALAVGGLFAGLLVPMIMAAFRKPAFQPPAEPPAASGPGTESS